MTSPAKARLHSIFPVEQYGDTFLVTPQGDAIGFSPSQIQIEVRGLEKLFGQSEGAHLIVDLEHTNYFGSEMIGFISRIGAKARQRGGRTAFCNVSTDMQGVFDVMKFEQIWETFDTTREALRVIATIPIQARIWAKRKWIYRVAAVAAIVMGAIYFPWPDRNREHYNTFLTYSSELSEMRRVPQGETQRNGFRKRFERQMRSILKELADASSRGDAGATYLYMAGKQCLLPMMNAQGNTRSDLERDFVTNMTEAAKYIERVSPPDDITTERQRRQTVGRQKHIPERAAERDGNSETR